MSNIDFINKIKIKKQKPIQKRRTKKRHDTRPLNRSKKQQHGGVSLKGIAHKVSKKFKRSKFSLFRETGIKIITTLDKLNRYLSFENINKKTNNKQFHTKILGKKIRLENYYQNKELNDYIKLSYRVSGARTSKYENPFYLCTTYKQGSIALISALKYIGKTFRLGPRAVFNLVTYSTKGMKKVYDEFFDKNDGFKKKYRNNANVLCYIANLITYFHNLNTYIHEFKVLYDNLRDVYKSDLSKQNAGKLGVFFNYEINNYISGIFKKNNTYSEIQEIDYRDANYLQFPENMNSLNNKLMIKYKILEHVSAVKLNKKNKLYFITPKIFNYTTQRNKDGKLVKVPKDKEIITKYGAFVVNILIGQVFNRLKTLQTKLRIFYDIYTFPEIAPVVKFYTGKKALIGEISLFKSQKTDIMDEKKFLEEVIKLSDDVDSRLEPFLNYLNTKVYDLSDTTSGRDDGSDKSNLEKYKIIMRYQKIVAYLKKMKNLFLNKISEKLRKEFITQVFKKIKMFIDGTSSIHINYFGTQEELEINITTTGGTEVDMIDTINKQFKLERQLNKELINQGNSNEINKFFDGVIIYFNKRRAEYEGLRGDLVENTAIKSVQRQLGGANLCYPILTKEKLKSYYDKLMELCNKNICLKDVEEVRKLIGPKFKNNKGIGKPIGLESRNIKVNFRNYILKIMMGNIYFDQDIIHSKLPFKDDIDRALQFIPYYIQGQYFKVGDEKDKYTQNYSNFVYLSYFVENKTKKYSSIQKNTRNTEGDLEFLKDIRNKINELSINKINIKKPDNHGPSSITSGVINNIKILENVLEEKTKTLQSLKEQETNINAKLKDIEKKITENNTLIETKQEEKEQLNKDLQATHTLINNLTSSNKKDEMRIKKSKLESKTHALDREIAKLNNEKNALETKKDDNTAQHTDLKITEKEVEITTLKLEITNATATTKTKAQNKIKNKINTLTENINNNIKENNLDAINTIIELYKSLSSTDYAQNINQLKGIQQIIKLVKNINININIEPLDSIKTNLQSIHDNVNNDTSNLIISGIYEIIEKITDEQNENCPKYKTSKYPLSFANLSLLTPLEIASLNGLADAGNLQVIMGEKGFEELNKRLRKSYTQRMQNFFGGSHMMVDIKIEIQGIDDGNNGYTKRDLTSVEMDNINSIITTLITSRGGDIKSKVKFGAVVLGIAGILSLATPVLSVPFVIGVLLNNRNRRELYKYQTLEQVLSEFNTRLSKNEKILTFYNTEIRDKGLANEFKSQVKGYFNLSRDVKFHDLYLHNNIEGYQDHKTTTEDILNNLIFLGKKVKDTAIRNEILLKGRDLEEPYKFIISKITDTYKYDKNKLQILSKSVIIRLLEKKNTSLDGGGITDTIKSGLSSAKTSIYEFGVENIIRQDLPYTYKFNKIDDTVKTELLDIIKVFGGNHNPNSSLEKFIYNIFTDTDLDMYGKDVLYAEAMSSPIAYKTYQLDKIILLLGLNRIVESLLYYLQNVDSIKKTLDETKQLLSRGTIAKYSYKTNATSKGGGNVIVGGDGTLGNKINAKKKLLENVRLGDIQSDEIIGKSSTLQHSLLRRNYNGMSVNGLIDGIDGVAIKMILYYRNNLLDLQQSENLIRQEFPNITKDLLRKYFHKVLTKLLVYLKCNEISYDYFHSSHYHLSEDVKKIKNEQESKIAELSNDPLEILNGTYDDLDKNAELTAKILITEIHELSYISSSSYTYGNPEIEGESDNGI